VTINSGDADSTSSSSGGCRLIYLRLKTRATGIIWATGRPTDSNPAAVNLYAFAATPSSGTLPLLFSSPAGSWGNTEGNANIVPLVANGHVFVASNQQLTIFGLGGHPFVARAGAAAQPAALNTPKPPHEITGVLEHVDGPVLTLRTRAGKIARVDDSEALRRKQIGVLVLGYAARKCSPHRHRPARLPHGRIGISAGELRGMPLQELCDLAAYGLPEAINDA
jgi:hypothetical protein